MSFTDDGSPSGDQGQDLYEGLSDYAKSFVNGLPEDERAVVAKHVKGWDAGFTRKMQEVQSELGWAKHVNPKDAENAMRFATAFQHNPTEVLKAALEQGHLSTDQLQQIVGTPAGQQKLEELGVSDSDTAKLERLLESKLAEKLKKYDDGLGATSQWIVERDRETKASRLEQDLNAVNEKHGGVLDTTMLLAFMQQGLDMDTAVERHLAINKRIAEQGRAPRASFSMPGAGTNPNFAKNLSDPSKTSDDALNQAIADLFGQ